MLGAILDDLIFHQHPVLFAGLVLVLIALSIELPYRYGARLFKRDQVQDDVWNALYAGLLALVAFMLGLSYAQAQGRFDARRDLVIKEGDSIGVTWRRAEQLSQPQRSEFRSALLGYTQKRLSAYERPSDERFFNNAIHTSDDEQEGMWRTASAALHADATNQGLSLLLQSTDNLIDLSEDDYAALTQHIPTSVVIFTLLLVLLGSAFTGFLFARRGGRPGLFTAIYVLALALVIQMIVDLDRPQSGFITVNLEPLRAQVAKMERSP